MASGSNSSVDVSLLVQKSDESLKLGDEAQENGELETAIEYYGSALESRVSAFGELGAECALAYFKYGAALFQKTQKDSDVLGPAGQKLEKGPEQEEDEEEEEEENVEDVKGKGKAKVEEEPVAAADAAEEDLDDGEDEEESDGELAWRLLETARCIYDKQPRRSLEEVDVICALADFSLEKEDFDACLQDYHHALTLLEGLVAPDHRRVIEIYFKMALANQTTNRTKEALECCHRAVQTCEARIRRAQSLLDAKVQGAAKAAAPPAGADGVEVKEAEKAAPDGSDAVEGSDADKGKSETGDGAGPHAGGAGSGSAAGGDAALHDTINEESCEGDLRQEIDDVQQIANDLKEKVDELKEMLRLPSIEKFLRDQFVSFTSPLQGKPSAGVGPSTAASSAPGPGVSPLSVPLIPPTATVASMPQSVAAASVAAGSKEVARAAEGQESFGGEKRPAEVVVVGRGKKRATPVPISVEEAAALTWPGVVG